MIPQQQSWPDPPARRGRPVLGGIAGFFLGLFLWIDLILFGVIPLASGLGYLLLPLGVAVGIGVAYRAPFGPEAPPAQQPPPPSVPPPA